MEPSPPKTNGIEPVAAQQRTVSLEAEVVRSEAWMRVSTRDPDAVPSPRKAEPLEIPREATLDEAIARILANGLEQLRANEASARDGRDPEGVHELRVGARRLRSALSLFRKVLPNAQVERLRAELRWLSGQLGPARDLDVFLAETLAAVEQTQAPSPELARIREVATRLRRRLDGTIRETLESRRHRELMLELERFIERRAWLDPPDSPSSSRLRRPAREYAARQLERRHEKTLAAGRHVEKLEREAQHALRIRVKKLRYASEFFGPLFAKKKVRRLRKRLATLQDVLGHLNDQRTAEAVLDSILDALGADATPALQRAAGVVSGHTAHAADISLAELRQAWRAFEKTRVFWKKKKTDKSH